MELVDRMVALLEEDGILVYNIIHSQGSDKCKEIPLLNKHKELTLFYSNHRNNADNYVIIACKWTVHTIR